MTGIMVTGATGYIGANIVAGLLKYYDTIQVVAALRTSQQAQELQTLLGNPSRLSFRYGNLPDKAWDLQGIDVLMHCAALLIGSNSSMLFQVNVEGTRNLLVLAKKHHLKRVVFISSQSVYGASRAVQLQEDMPAQPASLYAVSKLAGELLCVENEFAELQTIILRLPRIYGTGLLMREALLPHYYARLTAQTEQLPVFIHNQSSINYLHIADMVEAVCNTATKNNLPEKLILNIGNSQAITNIELVKICQEAAQLCKIPVPEVTLIAKGSDISIASGMNIGRAKVYLDWSPQITLLAGMHELIQSLIKS